MKNKTWTNLQDRSRYNAGPWDEELEDKIQWFNEDAKLPCLLVRNQFGNWCGYVGVLKGHPYFGGSYNDPPVEVHGGLTFAAGCQKDNALAGICHIVEPGEDDNVWWFGFDTGHAWDVAPRESLIHHGDATYKDKTFTMQETNKLALQLRALA